MYGKPDVFELTAADVVQLNGFYSEFTKEMCQSTFGKQNYVQLALREIQKVNVCNPVLISSASFLFFSFFLYVSQKPKVYHRMKIGSLKFRSKSKDFGKSTQNSYIKVFFDEEVWFAQVVGFCRYKPFSLDCSPEDDFAIVEWMERCDKKKSFKPKKEYAEFSHLHVRSGVKSVMHLDRWVKIENIAGANVIAFPIGRSQDAQYIMCDWDMTVTID